MDDAFNYVKDNGITTDDKYAYKGTTQSCQSFTSDFKISSHVDVPKNSMSQMVAAL